MPLFGRAPKVPVEDSSMQGLSEMFWQYPQTPGSDILAGGTFNYGLASLALVEAYLTAMRARKPEGRDLFSVVVRSGAYVGEVIRRNSKRDWHWLKYEEALRVERRLASQTEPGIATQWVLWDSRNSFAFPLGTVIKYFNGEAIGSLAEFVSDFIRQEGR